TLAYGSREAAGLMIALGAVMQYAGRHSRIAREGVSATYLENAGAWTNDPIAFDQAVRAALTLLNAVRPDVDGGTKSPVPIDELREPGELLLVEEEYKIPPISEGEPNIANELMRAIRGDRSSAEHFYLGTSWSELRAMLGPLATRIKEPKA